MRLSILLPYFNTPWPLLRAQLDSIAAADLRSFTAVELVLVDDGSAPTLADAVDAWAGRAPFTVRHLRHDGNRGLANALNTAMAEATGDWLAFADGDDLTHPQRFAVQAAYLLAHPDLVAVGADMIELAPDGTRGRCRRFPVDDAAIRVELLFYCAMAQPALMLRRTAWAALDVWRTPGTGMAEDWDFFIRLAECGRLGNCGQALVDYRLHPAQMTATLSAAAPHPAVLALWRRQLVAMGVSVDDGLLAVHAALSPYWLWPYGDVEWRPAPPEIERWRAALLRANRVSSRYAEAALQARIDELLTTDRRSALRDVTGPERLFDSA
ncbi:glycosyltransferase family 2 protein [Jeongeupia naejangsanensis]|uniref:Glycosyltransferase family 2 protein n=1 Tax=Jeongeupia naejangsanensis TaxID=613195 RepID=A0ABS2BQ99_9NEIS|nr:glycosyltransferase family A protein [Jeongeupia naejangsanensis]MBM3117748.1 glycosyltransferase family 2 protein [Jeongeupia naejangsanensis]